MVPSTLDSVIGGMHEHSLDVHYLVQTSKVSEMNK